MRSPGLTVGRSARSAPRTDGVDVVLKHIKGRVVGFAPSTDDEISGRKRRDETYTYELAKLAFQSIALDGRMLMLWHHDSDARMIERGSEDPDVEMPGPDSLPLSNDGL